MLKLSLVSPCPDRDSCDVHGWGDGTKGVTLLGRMALLPLVSSISVSDVRVGEGPLRASVMDRRRVSMQR